ncbi:MAG: TetR/AcrR family transcriptional regulator [Actinomycetota bacterium]|nr:TetR/AcrR family transcriptional regulator [Actinomycetota bacterium]
MLVHPFEMADVEMADDDAGHPGPPRQWREPRPGRGPSRASRGRRRDILDAALRLFNGSGYARTGVQDIAWEAEASVGSIYHHFDGKEDIAAALYVEGLRDYQRGLFRELMPPAQEPSAEQAIKGLVRHHVRWVARNEPLARFLLTSHDPEVVGAAAEELRALNRRTFETVQRWIDRWVGEGEVRELPIALFHAVVLGPSQELARHWVAGRVKEYESAEDALAEAAWRAVKA